MHNIKRLNKIKTTSLSFCLRETPFGPVALVWSRFHGRPMIQRVILSKPGSSAGLIVAAGYPDCSSSSCPEIDTVADRVAAFLAGDDIHFPLNTIRLDFCSSFQQKVLYAEHGIPRGSVSTYQRIARRVGNVKGARAVGAALAGNPFPIIIPCHRAIRSDRTLGGYQGGLNMKRTLLEMEGVRFDPSGRVETDAYFY
ncbi:MAG: methylated-DNA--[protein]-cysteine S-methyltransferase [Desulfobacterales bacterium]|nr:methylated-DNA--[protein]-cysteine S-methyltransferase [Desulfobacterales bacterium]